MRRELRSLPRLAFLTAATTVVLVACGSRGPLDADLVPATNDASVLGPGDPSGSGGSTAPTSSPPAPPAPPTADAGDAAAPRNDAGTIGTVIACGACVTSTCGDPILACLRSEACRTTFQCVVSTCLGSGGGGLNPLCLFKCASSDPSGALQALGVFTCLTGQCGDDCGSLIGGLGGLGGGKSNPGNNLPASQGEFSEEAFRTVMSPWPELLTPGAKSE